MNEDEEFLEEFKKIEAEIDFSEDFSNSEMESRESDYRKIKELCLKNPLYKRRKFRVDDENILNVCYECENFLGINALLNRRSARRKYQYSYTLLMAIICNPYLEETDKCHMIDGLIKLGTEINHRNIFDETALHLAVLSHQKLVAECLLKNGANPNIEGIHNISPLMIACYFADFYTASLLIHYGADINAESTFTEWKVMDFAMLSRNIHFKQMIHDLGAKGGIGYNLLIQI